MSAPVAVARFAAAASAGDAATVHALIDYPLSGAARVVRALAGVDLADRERIARSGLGELQRVSKMMALPNEVRHILEQLAGSTSLRHATDEETLEALRRVHVPASPAGLTSMTESRLELLRQDVARLTNVYVISAGEHKRLTVATSPAREQVVLIL
jgi:hypothetical protein